MYERAHINRYLCFRAHVLTARIIWCWAAGCAEQTTSTCKCRKVNEVIVRAVETVLEGVFVGGFDKAVFERTVLVYKGL